MSSKVLITVFDAVMMRSYTITTTVILNWNSEECKYKTFYILYLL